MNVIKEIEKITNLELDAGIYGGISKGSWHDKYKNSAWVILTGLHLELSEGDIICVMSQWGEIEDINLVREQENNKSKGFCFIKYEDQRSTILAVDNFNGVVLLERTIRCDHVEQYKLPKHIREKEEEILKQDPNAELKIQPGHAYQGKQLANDYNIQQGLNLWSKDEVAAKDSNQSNGSGKKKKKKKDHEHKDKSHKKHKSDKKEKLLVPDDGLGMVMDDDERDDSRVELESEDRIEDVNLLYRKKLLSLESSLATNNPIVEAASWRGHRDPNLIVAVQTNSKFGLPKAFDPNAVKDESEMMKKKDEWTGMGGMNRLR